MKRFSRLSIGLRLSLLVTISAALVLLLLTWRVYHQSAAAYEAKSRAGLATATHVMQDTLALYDRTLTENTERLTGSFAALLPKGAVGHAPGRPLQLGDFAVPALTFGGEPMPDDHAWVDRFTENTSAVATLFSRTGDDFVRISTSLTNDKGERVIGTPLDHKHPAYPLVLAGKPYTGRARLFGHDYMTHYRPLRDAAGEVVGILFVGVDYGGGLAALKERMRELRLSDDGYFFAVDGADGANRGKLVIHPGAEGLEARSLVAAKDQAAFQALLDGKGGIAVLDLSAKPGAAARPAMVDVEYFAPWKWTLVGVEPRAGLSATLHGMMTVMLALSALAIAVIAVLVFVAARRMVSRPLARVGAIAHDIADGTLDGHIDTHGHDEVAELMRSMHRMQGDLRQRIERDGRTAAENMRIRVALDNASIGVMITDQDLRVIYANPALGAMLEAHADEIARSQPGFDPRRSLLGVHVSAMEKDGTLDPDTMEQLQRHGTAQREIGFGSACFDQNISMIRDGDRVVGSVCEWRDRSAEAAVEASVAQVVQAAVNGDLSQRLSEEGKSGFQLQLARQLNGLLDANADSLEQVSALLAGLSEGDLTARIEGDFHGVFAQMRDDANVTVTQLTGIIDRIQLASTAINTAAGEIASGNNDLSRRTEQQAANLEETAASMEELTSTVKQNAEHARQANQLAQGAAGVARDGGQVVGKVVSTMSEIERSSKKIAEIISVIDGIAFQTNILALNAAVEAARAGEQGRGFAVVASEVRTLAQRSANAAKEIKGLIDDSVGKVADGSALVHKAGQTMGEIVASVQRVTDIMSEISAASQEQSAGIEQVNQTVTQMDETTQQNAALVEEATAAARSMEEQAQQLAGAVALFRIAGDPPAPKSRKPARTERSAVPA